MNTLKWWLGAAGVDHSQKTVLPGHEYDPLIPKPLGNDEVIDHNADVSVTVDFIPKVVKSTLSQTRRIANKIRGPTIRDTCRNLWRLIRWHVRYSPDQNGEQVRSPSRLWWDRKGDCDCYTTFISSVLANLWIPHKYRLTKYNEDHFQHIYPVVQLPSGEEIIIDCVTRYFDYEEEYKEKMDVPMQLQYLNGTVPVNSSGSIGSLGKSKVLNKKGKVIKRALHKINRVNPGTIAIRNGILAAMKINFMNIAGRLKYAYLTDKQATARRLHPLRLGKVRGVLHKLENIFFGAGGKLENLRNAILSGKGNKRDKVNGLGNVNALDAAMRTEDLRQILGDDLFRAENPSINGLGVVGTISVGAASGLLAAIAGLLKAIGSLKGGDQPDSESPDAPSDPLPELVINPPVAEDANDGSNQRTTNFADDPVAATAGRGSGNSITPTSNSRLSDPPLATNDSTSTEENTSNAAGSNEKDEEESKGISGWIKDHPLATTGIAIGTALLITGIVYAAKNSGKPAAAPPPKGYPTNGLPMKKRKKKKKKSRRRNQAGPKYNTISVRV